MGLVFLFPGLWGSYVQGNFTLFALFMGTALSISALPVIARILHGPEPDEVRSMGMIVMGCCDRERPHRLVPLRVDPELASRPRACFICRAYVTFVLVLLIFVLMLTVGRVSGRARPRNGSRPDLPWPGAFSRA